MVAPAILPRPLLEALERLRVRLQKKHPQARFAIQDSWWKKTQNVSATFFGPKSVDGAEVVLSSRSRPGIEGELYVERSLVAELPMVAAAPDGSPTQEARAALEGFLQRCEPLIDAHLAG